MSVVIKTPIVRKTYNGQHTQASFCRFNSSEYTFYEGKNRAFMNKTNRMHDCELLDGISVSCLEIQQALTEHLETTTNVQYKTDIDKDLVTLENLKHIIFAVKEDVEKEKVGASTELLLRIAANDFKNKLALIPEKKTLRKEIMRSLKEVHSNILHLSI
jgi:hypothetical protein